MGVLSSVFTDVFMTSPFLSDGFSDLFNAYRTLLNTSTTLSIDPALTFTRSSNATYFDSTGTMQTASTDVPRFTYGVNSTTLQGLLIEESRTNSLRNSTMVGASTSPSTLPTNWFVRAANSLTTTVVGTGTQYGMNYVDIQISGTPSASPYLLSMETTTQISAATGQIWTGSFYIKSVGGATTNISALGVRTEGLTSAGGTISGEIADGTVTLGSISTLQRIQATRTMTDATVGRVTAQLRIALTVSSAINITVRIYAPQLERALATSSINATSFIPTSTTAATRSQDILSTTNLPSAGILNSSQGTIVFNGSYNNIGVTVGQTLFSMSDSTQNNIMYLKCSTGSPTYTRGSVTTGGVGQITTNTANSISAANTLFKAAFSWGPSGFAWCLNGGTVVTGTGTIPSFTTFAIGRNGSSQECLNGNVNYIAVYPTESTSTTLQTLTT